MIEQKLRSILVKLSIQVTSKSAEGWLRGHCPFATWLHAKGTDNKPAFGAYISDDGDSYYKCLACHQGGRIHSLVRSLEYYRQTSYPGLALEADLADAQGVVGLSYEDQMAHRLAMAEDVPNPVDEASVRGMYEPAYSLPHVAQYLARRGVSEETANFLGLLYDPDERRVLFPVRDRQGLLYGFSGRSVLRDEHFDRMYKGYPKIRDYLGLAKRHFLLGEHLWQPNKPAFVVEGLIGFASLVDIGARRICNPLAIMGSEMTALKVNRLELLNSAVYLMFDNDTAGETCLWGPYDENKQDFRGGGAYDRLRKKNIPIFIPAWPVGKDDPDQLLYEDLKAIIENCPPYVESI